MNKIKIKKNTGITLVALVVTIIVLLILAGITITMVLSNGGIIGKAKDSASIYNQKAKEENGRLADYENAILKANNGESILAQKISSDDVAFEPVDPNWKVHSVKEALDYLYENQ